MDPMITQGFQFLLVGMSVVFAFLILMVVVMNIAASVLKNFPEEEVAEKPASKAKKSAEGDDESEIALAIAIAKARQN